jgi:phosphonate metabolism protein PhnN/1,5-bisphosphokinase (PRPP-forming)
MENNATKIVLIVGASGVGKDSLLKSIQNQTDAKFIRRYITREPDANESNFYLDENAFLQRQEQDFFLSTWQAHNNLYGIARPHIEPGVNIISISRGAIKDFEKAYEDVTTIHITLSKEELEKRLRARGREDENAIQKRLNRTYPKIEAKKLIEFDNSDPLKIASQNFLTLLQEL